MSSLLSRAGFRSFRLGRFSRLWRPKTAVWGAVLLVLALGLLLTGLMQGSLPVPASAIGHALFFPQALNAEQLYIVWDIRLPRLLMALLCGAMLGMAGAAMQSITRNGLADPGLLGVKEGSSVAVLALILLFPALGLARRPVAGMAGGLLAALIVLLLARDFSRPRFILLGIGVSRTFAAGIGVFMTTADVRDVQTALVWLAGSLHTATAAAAGGDLLGAACRADFVCYRAGLRCGAARPSGRRRAGRADGVADAHSFLLRCY